VLLRDDRVVPQPAHRLVPVRVHRPLLMEEMRLRIRKPARPVQGRKDVRVAIHDGHRTPAGDRPLMLLPIRASM